MLFFGGVRDPHEVVAGMRPFNPPLVLTRRRDGMLPMPHAGRVCSASTVSLAATCSCDGLHSVGPTSAFSDPALPFLPQRKWLPPRLLRVPHVWGFHCRKRHASMPISARASCSATARHLPKEILASSPTTVGLRSFPQHPLAGKREPSFNRGSA